MYNEIMPSDDGRAWVEIDLDALGHNASKISSHLPYGCELMAVVKSDAYGHGIVQCAKRLHAEGVKIFGVATIVEGIGLREAVPNAEILIFGYTHPKDAKFLHEYSLCQIVVDGTHAQQLNDMGFSLRVHIALDTGMHRLGIRPGNLEEIESVFSCKNLKIDGIATHLASSDSLDKEDVRFTNFQIERFNSIIETLKNKGYDVGKRHVQASYGIFNFPELACDYARAGIALYGAMSDLEEHIKPDLRPVLSLKALVSQVRWIGAGERVSYGGIFTTTKVTKIATVGIGYADGVPRQISGNGGMCLVRGKKTPILGRICMDMLMIDVTEVEDVKAGDVVTLIGRDGGEEIRCEDFAAASGTIAYDILCRLGGRLPRIYSDV